MSAQPKPHPVQPLAYRGEPGSARRRRPGALPLPGFLRPFLNFGYDILQGLSFSAGWLFSFFLREPFFRGRCVSAGKGFQVWKMPYVNGATRIHIGDHVRILGKIGIFSGRIFDDPTLILGNRVTIADDVVFLVNKEVVLEDDVTVASGARFMDTDAHPRDTAERIADLPPRPEEVKPVRIKHHARIGQGSFIMKGVTVGEGAIVGVNSVVVSDIPPYCLVMGNPARVVAKDVNQPTSN
ncbi:MAG TPA: acyltransferase [Terriglobales bacterium]|nr:acyltransferase [Terriglobales bacterium]